MNYKLCYLYGLKSKSKLRELLHIDRKLYGKGSFVNQKISPYISKSGGKERLIEAPEEDIKKIQGIILMSSKSFLFWICAIIQLFVVLISENNL